MKNAMRGFLFGGTGTATTWGDIGLAILRIGIGLFIALGHGMGKVLPEGGFGPSAGFVGGVEKLGFPLPALFAWAAALTEFLGGILLAMGLLTRPAALALAFNMAVAAFGQHLNDPFFAKGPGPSKEFALLYLLPFLFLLFAGAGRFSADRMIRGR